MNLLPFDIKLSLVKDWLSLLDIGRLDSAVCDFKERKDLLNILAHKYCVLYENLGSQNQTALNWTSLREVRLMKLCAFAADCTDLPSGIILTNVAILQICFGNNKKHCANINEQTIRTNLLINACQSVDKLICGGKLFICCLVLRTLQSNIFQRLDTIEILDGHLCIKLRRIVDENNHIVFQFRVFNGKINAIFLIN